MTDIAPMTYEELVNLNNISNLVNFIAYLQSRNVLHFAPHIDKFGNTVLGTVKEMYEDWLKSKQEV